MPKRTVGLIALTSVVISSLAVQPSEAGPILDWLFHRNRQPVAVPVATCAPAQQTIVSYVPQTHYRTSYARVPVTNYRPVTALDPTTGCPVTVMQPCTTYQWQARRVPYTTFRPVLMPVATAPGVAAPAGCACPTTGAVTVPGPVGTTPQYVLPQQGAATMPGPAYGAAPQGYPSAMPGAAADTVPSLDPGAMQQHQQQRPEVEVQRSPYFPPYNPGSPATGSTGSGTTGSGTGQDTSTPQATNREASQSFSPLRPIPDPEVNRRDNTYPPQLVNPRDRTAVVQPPQAWAYTPITWAKPVSYDGESQQTGPELLQPVNLQPVPQAETPSVQLAPVQPVRVDDRGWRSVK